MDAFRSFTETCRLSKRWNGNLRGRSNRPTDRATKEVKNNKIRYLQSVTAGGACRCTRYGSGHGISLPVSRVVGVGCDACSIQLVKKWVQKVINIKPVVGFRALSPRQAVNENWSRRDYSSVMNKASAPTKACVTSQGRHSTSF